MKKLIKYQKETVEYQILNVVAAVLGIVAVIISAYLAYNLLTSESFLEGLSYGCILIIIFIGYSALIGFVHSKSKNNAYNKQQAELKRLKELEATCGEYHKLKNKYKGVQI